LVRPATPEDTAAVVDLVVAAEMFSADDAWLVEGMLTDYFETNKEDGHVCVIDNEGGPLEIAYYPAQDRRRSGLGSHDDRRAARPSRTRTRGGYAPFAAPYPVVRQAGREYLIATSAPTPIWGPPR
jgi:hypothetical protein